MITRLAFLALATLSLAACAADSDGGEEAGSSADAIGLETLPGICARTTRHRVADDGNNWDTCLANAPNGANWKLVHWEPAVALVRVARCEWKNADCDPRAKQCREKGGTVEAGAGSGDVTIACRCGTLYMNQRFNRCDDGAVVFEGSK